MIVNRERTHIPVTQARKQFESHSKKKAHFYIHVQSLAQQFPERSQWLLFSIKKLQGSLQIVLSFLNGAIGIPPSSSYIECTSLPMLFIMLTWALYMLTSTLAHTAYTRRTSERVPLEAQGSSSDGSHVINLPHTPPPHIDFTQGWWGARGLRW